MKIKDVDSETKATVTILIREIQDILKQPHLRVSQIKTEISELLDSWIKANDLHPEHVKILGPFISSNAWDYTKEQYWTTNAYTSFWFEIKS